MGYIINSCAESKFNSGANPCNFEPGKIRGLIFHDKNVDWATIDNATTRLDTEEGLINLAHYDRPNRMYPVGGIVAYEGSGGEAQTSQVGYGSTRITGYSEKQMTFTFNERSQNLLASVISSGNLANYRVFFVDDENCVYGYDGGGGSDWLLDGVPIGGASVGGQEWETQDNPAALTLTLYINDYARFLQNLRVVQVNYDIVDAMEGAGLNWVDVKKRVVGADTYVRFLLHFGGKNITEVVYNYLSAGTPLTIFKAMFPGASSATAVSYSNGELTVTGNTAIGSMADPQTLATAGVYGIEEWVD